MFPHQLVLHTSIQIFYLRLKDSLLIFVDGFLFCYHHMYSITQELISILKRESKEKMKNFQRIEEIWFIHEQLYLYGLLDQHYMFAIIKGYLSIFLVKNMYIFYPKIDYLPPIPMVSFQKVILLLKLA